MARVYIEYTKNLVVKHPDYFMLAVFVMTSFFLVSTRDVLMNIPRDSFPSFFNFFVVALRKTSFVIQIFIVGFFVRAIVMGAILVRKNFSDKLSLSWLKTFKY
jgi:hypothetical protein